MCDDDVGPDLLRIVEHGRHSCEHRLTELQHIRSRGEAIDCIRSEVCGENERVCSGATGEDSFSPPIRVVVPPVAVSVWPPELPFSTTPIGPAGATVSIVTFNAVEAALVLAAASLAVAVRL